MRYLIPVLCLTFSVSAAAADLKPVPDKTWTENKPAALRLAQETQPNDAQTPTRKPWTEECQYGKNDMPKTGKPEEKGEFEVAPGK